MSSITASLQNCEKERGLFNFKVAVSEIKDDFMKKVPEFKRLVVKKGEDVDVFKSEIYSVRDAVKDILTDIRKCFADVNFIDISGFEDISDKNSDIDIKNRYSDETLYKKLDDAYFEMFKNEFRDAVDEHFKWVEKSVEDVMPDSLEEALNFVPSISSENPEEEIEKAEARMDQIDKRMDTISEAQDSLITEWYVDADAAKKMVSEFFDLCNIFFSGNLLRMAENEDSDAQYLLGSIYFEGLLTNKNSRAAERWLVLAEENGDERAEDLLKSVRNDS